MRCPICGGKLVKEHNCGKYMMEMLTLEPEGTLIEFKCVNGHEGWMHVLTVEEAVKQIEERSGESWVLK